MWQREERERKSKPLFFLNLNQRYEIYVDMVRYLEDVLKIGEKKFNVNVLIFDNGCFLSLSEGKERIGAFTLSLPSLHGKPEVYEIMQVRYGKLLANVLAQKLSEKFKGISIVSVSFSSELSNDEVREVLRKVKEMVE